MNQELYQVSTLALLTALVSVFGWLWLQGRSHPARGLQIGQAPRARQRHLLWLAGWSLSVLRLGRCPDAPRRGRTGRSRCCAWNWRR
jgi:hypothetical protein